MKDRQRKKKNKEKRKIDRELKIIIEEVTETEKSIMHVRENTKNQRLRYFDTGILRDLQTERLKDYNTERLKD